MADHLRVAYDAGPLLDLRTGVGRYARELADALAVTGVELVPYAIAARGGRSEGMRRWRVPARLVQTSWRRLGAPRIQRLVGKVDAVHATNFVLPALGREAGVLTVHDLSFLRDDTFPGGERLRDLVPWSTARAAAILTPTEAVKQEVCDAYGAPAASVHVTHEGVSPLFFGATPLSDGALRDLGLAGPYVLAVGTIEPRKNLPRLLEAWRSVRAELPEMTLAIAGPKGWGPELPEAPGVRLLGWVGDETLPGLLAAAEVFCYPSLYEGFGLPPLEAMAAGTAAVVGDYPAAAEILGDAAIVVRAREPEDIAAGLARVLSDEGLRKDLARRGRARAAEFSWLRTAKETLAAYQVAVAR
ncbi:MAG TPA: glycosyltransferase family 1 protein [Actinomycetota bacterium]|nr:glycosyltransferase family 1 protein [Actinomycetota bacterium]